MLHTLLQNTPIQSDESLRFIAAVSSPGHQKESLYYLHDPIFLGLRISDEGQTTVIHLLNPFAKSNSIIDATNINLASGLEWHEKSDGRTFPILSYRLPFSLEAVTPLITTLLHLETKTRQDYYIRFHETLGTWVELDTLDPLDMQPHWLLNINRTCHPQWQLYLLAMQSFYDCRDDFMRDYQQLVDAATEYTCIFQVQPFYTGDKGNLPQPNGWPSNAHHRWWSSVNETRELTINIGNLGNEENHRNLDCVFFNQIDVRPTIYWSNPEARVYFYLKTNAIKGTLPALANLPADIADTIEGINDSLKSHFYGFFYNQLHGLIVIAKTLSQYRLLDNPSACHTLMQLYIGRTNIRLRDYTVNSAKSHSLCDGLVMHLVRDCENHCYDSYKNTRVSNFLGEQKLRFSLDKHPYLPKEGEELHKLHQKHPILAYVIHCLKNEAFREQLPQEEQRFYASLKPSHVSVTDSFEKLQGLQACPKIERSIRFPKQNRHDPGVAQELRIWPIIARTAETSTIKQYASPPHFTNQWLQDRLQLCLDTSGHMQLEQLLGFLQLEKRSLQEAPQRCQSNGLEQKESYTVDHHYLSFLLCSNRITLDTSVDQRIAACRQIMKMSLPQNAITAADWHYHLLLIDLCKTLLTSILADKGQFDQTYLEQLQNVMALQKTHKQNMRSALTDTALHSILSDWYQLNLLILHAHHHLSRHLHAHWLFHSWQREENYFGTPHSDFSQYLNSLMKTTANIDCACLSDLMQKTITSCSIKRHRHALLRQDNYDHDAAEENSYHPHVHLLWQDHNNQTRHSFLVFPIMKHEGHPLPLALRSNDLPDTMVKDPFFVALGQRDKRRVSIDEEDHLCINLGVHSLRYRNQLELWHDNQWWLYTPSPYQDDKSGLVSFWYSQDRQRCLAWEQASPHDLFHDYVIDRQLANNVFNNRGYLQHPDWGIRHVLSSYAFCDDYDHPCLQALQKLSRQEVIMFGHDNGQQRIARLALTKDIDTFFVYKGAHFYFRNYLLWKGESHLIPCPHMALYPNAQTNTPSHVLISSDGKCGLMALRGNIPISNERHWNTVLIKQIAQQDNAQHWTMLNQILRQRPPLIMEEVSEILISMINNLDMQPECSTLLLRLVITAFSPSISDKAMKNIENNECLLNTYTFAYCAWQYYVHHQNHTEEFLLSVLEKNELYSILSSLEITIISHFMNANSYDLAPTVKNQLTHLMLQLFRHLEIDQMPLLSTLFEDHLQLRKTHRLMISAKKKVIADCMPAYTIGKLVKSSNWQDEPSKFATMLQAPKDKGAQQYMRIQRILQLKNRTATVTRKYFQIYHTLKLPPLTRIHPRIDFGQYRVDAPSPFKPSLNFSHDIAYARKACEADDSARQTALARFHEHLVTGDWMRQLQQEMRAEQVDIETLGTALVDWVQQIKTQRQTEPLQLEHLIQWIGSSEQHVQESLGIHALTYENLRRYLQYILVHKVHLCFLHRLCEHLTAWQADRNEDNLKALYNFATQQRNYNPYHKDYLRLLLLENHLESSLRPIQCEIYKVFAIDRPGGHITLGTMGVGKSTCLPIVAFEAAQQLKGKKLVTHCIPDKVWNIQVPQVRQLLQRVLSVDIVEFRTPANLDDDAWIRTMHTQLTACIREGIHVVTTERDRQMFLLLATSSKNAYQKKLLKEMVHYLTGSHSITDEIDEARSVQQEVILADAGTEPFPQTLREWLIKVLNFLDKQHFLPKGSPSTYQQGFHAKYHTEKKQSFEDIRENVIKALIAEEQSPLRELLSDYSPERQKTITDFLQNPKQHHLASQGLGQKAIDLLYTLKKCLYEHFVNILNIGDDQHGLSDNLDYKESIPCQDGMPLEECRFGHDFERLILTWVDYNRKPLIAEHIADYFSINVPLIYNNRFLNTQLEKNSLYQFLNRHQDLNNIVTEITSARKIPDEHMILAWSNRFYQYFENLQNMGCIDNYLQAKNQLIYDYYWALMKRTPKKSRITAADLLPTHGCSGTNSQIFSLDPFYRASYQQNPIDLAKVAHVLAEQNKNKPLRLIRENDFQNDHWPALLNAQSCAIIDAGFLIKKSDMHAYAKQVIDRLPVNRQWLGYLSNDQFYLMHRTHKQAIQSGTDIASLLLHTAHEPHEENTLLNQLFVIFDCPRARAMDIRLHPQGEVVLTLAEDNDYDKAMQGAARARNLGSQTVSVVLEEALYQKLDAAKQLNYEGLLAHLIANTQTMIHSKLIKGALQHLAGYYRDFLLRLWSEEDKIWWQQPLNLLSPPKPTLKAITDLFASIDEDVYQTCRRFKKTVHVQTMLNTVLDDWEQKCSPWLSQTQIDNLRQGAKALIDSPHLPTYTLSTDNNVGSLVHEIQRQQVRQLSKQKDIPVKQKPIAAANADPKNSQLLPASNGYKDCSAWLYDIMDESNTMSQLLCQLTEDPEHQRFARGQIWYILSNDNDDKIALISTEEVASQCDPLNKIMSIDGIDYRAYCIHELVDEKVFTYLTLNKQTAIWRALVLAQHIDYALEMYQNHPQLRNDNNHQLLREITSTYRPLLKERVIETLRHLGVQPCTKKLSNKNRLLHAWRASKRFFSKLINHSVWGTLLYFAAVTSMLSIMHLFWPTLMLSLSPLQQFLLSCATVTIMHGCMQGWMKVVLKGATEIAVRAVKDPKTALAFNPTKAASRLRAKKAASHSPSSSSDLNSQQSPPTSAACDR